MADETLGAAQYRSRQDQSDPAGVMGWKLGDRYEVQTYLGGGGFSWVYKAWDHVLNIDVAAKVMKGGASFSDEDFRREALLQAKFSARHDNAVHVYAYGIDRGRPWLAMQLCDGRTLHEIIEEYRQKGERIPRETMLLFVNEITKVLGAAHADNLIHRDLKPNNIMLVHEGTPSERFKLMDFGLSSKVDAEMDETIRNYTKASWGTPEYMSPEQIQAVDSQDTASPQSDVYSLGVILYQILTGHVPFPLVDYSPLRVAECQLAVVQKAPETASRASEFGDIPPKAEKVVMECLAKNPADRPGSMEEIRKRFLEAFAPSLDIPMTSLSLSRRNAIMAGATILGLLAALGILAYALLWSGNSSQTLEFTFDNLEFQFERGETRTEEISLFGNFDGLLTLELIPREPRPERVSIPKEIQFRYDAENKEIRKAELPIKVERDAAEGTFEFELRADAEHKFMQEHLNPLTLTIIKPAAPCPAGFEPVAGDDSGSEFQWIRDRAFYRRLDYVVNGEKVRFVFVESESADTSSGFFYIMERPVSVGLYEQFAEARNIPESERYYKSDDHGVDWEVTAEQPVTNLTYQEAYDFAVWLSHLNSRKPKRAFAFDLPTVPGQIDTANKTGRIFEGQIAALEAHGDDFFEFTSSGFRVYRPHEVKLPYKKSGLTDTELEGDNVFVYSLKFDEADPKPYWNERDRATGFRLIVEFIE